jgi:hypothetical protein
MSAALNILVVAVVSLATIIWRCIRRLWTDTQDLQQRIDDLHARLIHSEEENRRLHRMLAINARKSNG